uniref:UPAR/Ly6 domain-containing protein qvr n=1 Tax=Nyssomyia neivai TaxID=330878 RepID=A0A1L8DQZ5_9DIPT
MTASCGNLTRVLGLVLLLLSVDSGSTLRCYVCSSLNNVACADPPNMTQIAVTECGPLIRNPVCTKRTTRTPQMTFTGRQCLSEDICDYALDVSGQVSEDCDTCTTDLCNTSFQHTPTYTVILLGIITEILRCALWGW